MATWGAKNPKTCPEGRAPRSSQKNRVINSQPWGLKPKMGLPRPGS